MVNFNWAQFWVTAVICILLAGFIGYISAPDVKVDQDAIDSAVSNATSELKDEILKLNLVIEGYENVSEVEEEVIPAEELGYVIDKVFLEIPFNKTLSDREVILFDGEVEFDGDDYDAEGVFTLTRLNLLANEPDFEGVPYLTILRNAISYVFEFEASLITSNISDEETLTFDFLGNEVEISEWDVDKVTFTGGTEYHLSQGDIETVLGKSVELKTVLLESVYILVNGEGKKIEEGETARFGDLEVYVKEVMHSGYAGGYQDATIVIGEKVGFEVEDREEYAEDSIWEWRIDKHSIGLVLVEEFTELEEDYNALAPGESVCLPNDYLCVIYDGVVEEDSEVYTFEVDGDFVRVDGNFLSGIEDYDRVYINSTGIYDDDYKGILLGPSIELGDTDLVLDIDILTGNITIRDFEVNLGLNWTNVGDEEENFLTYYGILVESPEDSIDDQEFKITVPEERLEATITVV